MVSPQGKGRTNYREWEALAAGAIPLVDYDSSAAMAELYQGLPVVRVRDWKKVTPAYLDAVRTRVFDAVAQGGASMSKLYVPSAPRVHKISGRRAARRRRPRPASSRPAPLLWATTPHPSIQLNQHSRRMSTASRSIVETASGRTRPSRSRGGLPRALPPRRAPADVERTVDDPALDLRLHQPAGGRREALLVGTSCRGRRPATASR